jgi:IS30 family transposase
MNYTQVTEIERYQIRAYLKAGYTQQAIARELDRAPSTISRELKRNTGLRGYRPQQAQRRAGERKQRHCHVIITDATWRRIVSLLEEDWSPEQISGWLEKSGQPTVSIEWIYHYILTDKNAGGELYRHLRCQKKRRKRYGSLDKRGQIKNRVSIDERPAIVDTRQRVGDWEMDLIIGRIGGSVLMTAVERTTRYTLIGLAPNKTAEEVKDCIVDIMKPLTHLVETQTYDNGKEFALHEIIAEALGASSYFAHPYHSWERGLNENTNGLIRQYARKGTSFDKMRPQDVINIMGKLNNRPRKCLDFQTPNQVLFGINPPVALTS